MAKQDYSALLQHFEIRESRLTSKIDNLQQIIKEQSDTIRQLEDSIKQLQLDNRHKQEYIDRLLSYNDNIQPQDNKKPNLFKRIFHKSEQNKPKKTTS